MVKIAFAIMRLAVSPIPIGRTPGFLLRAISLLAISGAVVSGSTRTVQRRFPVEARDQHRSRDADLKAVQSLLHASESSPEGPAEPLVFRAADLIMAASSDSKSTGWMSGGSSLMMVLGCKGAQVALEGVFRLGCRELFFLLQPDHPSVGLLRCFDRRVGEVRPLFFLET